MRSSATVRPPLTPSLLRSAKNGGWPLARLPEASTSSSSRANSSQSTKHTLLAQTRLLQSILESLGDAMVVADIEGQFLIWNAAAEDLLGPCPGVLPATQWAGRFGLYDPNECDLFPAEAWPVARALRGEAAESEVLIRPPHSSRSIWAEVTARPLKDGDAVIGAIAVFRDITSRKIGEQQILRLQGELQSQVSQRTAQLEAASKELESLCSSVAHDLRAPLRHIAGFAEIIVEEFSAPLDPRAREYLLRIQQGVRRMGVLADELLNLARIARQPVNLERVDLAALVRNQIAHLQAECEGRNVEWRVHELPIAHCDDALIRHVFLNLLSNALKYSRPKTHAIIEIGQTMRDGEMAIFVRDNGVGFNMKYSGKLFGVFERLHNGSAFEGTGVGLAIVQRIVQKHRGRVWAEAKTGQGATFYFTLKGMNGQK